MNARAIRLHAMNRRRLLIGLTGAAAMLSVTGCGGSDDGTAIDSDAPVRASPSPTQRAKSLHYASMASAELGVGARLNGSVPFPPDNPWNRAFSSTTPDASSAELIANLGPYGGLRCELGTAP